MSTVALPGAAPPKALGVAETVRRQRHGLALGVLVVLASAAYSLLGLVKFATFRSSVFDLVIFDQALRGYAGFGAPVEPSVGMQYGMGMDFIQLADHFSPIVALLAPLYWLHGGPQSLIVAQAVLFAGWPRSRSGTTPSAVSARSRLTWSRWPTRCRGRSRRRPGSTSTRRPSSRC